MDKGGIAGDAAAESMLSEPTVGEIIKQARERLGWTQAQLADKIGVTPSFVTKVEKNEAVPSYDRLIALSNILVLDSATLIALSEQVKEERTQQRLRTRGAVARSAYGMDPRAAAQEENPPGVTPNIAEQLGRQILEDPDLQLAFTWLRTLLANPDLKPVVLKTLEALSRSSTITRD